MIEFCVETYLPAIRSALSHVQLEPEEKLRFQGLVKGTGMKLLYAFVWQVKKMLEKILWKKRLLTIYLIFLIKIRRKC